LRGLISEDLGVFDETIPLMRVELLEIFQKRDARVGLIFTNDLTEREKNLLAVVGNHNSESRHVVHGQRLRDRGRQRLGEKRDSAFSFTVGGEVLGLEGMIFL
jgi:hypothetical protein